MRYRNILRAVAIACSALLAFGVGAFDEAAVENSFFPYKTWTPDFPGYDAGMVIDQSNVEQFEEILDPGMYDHLKNGRFKMQTAPTGSLELHPNYIQATRAAVANPPSLSADGTVANFVAGKPSGSARFVYIQWIFRHSCFRDI